MLLLQHDYCNALYTGISKSQILRLRFDHVTLLLRALHWLPVHYRIKFKVLLLVFKSLENLTALYLSDFILSYTPRTGLRSEGKSLLLIPRTRGSRAFALAGLTL